MMFWIGILIIIGTFAAIIKRYETRMVLFSSGLLMAILSGKAVEAIDTFTKSMVHSSLVPVICTVMGFAYVMKYTQCDTHMVRLLTKQLTRVRTLLIPMAVMLTFCVAIALPSAAGCAAAVGSILIPTMTASGIHPAIAASTVMIGTCGSVFSPGSAHTVFVAKLANIDVMSVIAGHSMAAIVCAVIATVCLCLVAVLRKEHTGYVAPDEISTNTADDHFNVSYIKAIIPAVPLILLVLGSKQLQVLPMISVPQAMIFGTLIGLIVTRCNPQELTKQFFSGLGYAYANIIGLIVAAAVFTKGMELIGVTGKLIEVMKTSDQIAMFAAGFGPMVIGILSGSGDAATLAFNGAITPQAAHFGYTVSDMGSLAFLSGAFGRTMSPVAGAAIICAQLASINPLEITKRTTLGMVCAAAVAMLMLS